MWQQLTSDAPQKYNNAEIERVKESNEALHSENEKLRMEVLSLTEGRKSLLEKIQAQEREKQAVQKELTKTQTNMKFEIKAREGLAKKTGLYEFEALNLRDECKNQREELGLLRFRAKDLDYKLNQERSKRLRDMHEADILRKRNIELESNGQYAEKDALKARQDLNDKLERMEVVLSQNESQKRVIESMSGEILALNSEISSLKQEIRRMTESKYKLDSSVSMQTREKEGLEREVWRLRKQLATGGGGGLHGSGAGTGILSFNESRGFGPGTTGGMSSGMIDAEASEASPFYNSDLREQSLFSSGTNTVPLGGRNGMLDSYQQRADVVTSSSTPHIPGYSQQGMKEAMNLLDGPRSQPSRGQNLSAEGKRFARSPFATRPTSPNKSIASIGERMGHYDEPKPSRKDKTQKKKDRTRQREAASNISGAPKSRFTGSGLGYRNDESPAFNPQGSAKSVLQRILREQHDQFTN